MTLSVSRGLSRRGWRLAENRGRIGDEEVAAEGATTSPKLSRAPPGITSEIDAGCVGGCCVPRARCSGGSTRASRGGANGLTAGRLAYPSARSSPPYRRAEGAEEGITTTLNGSGVAPSGRHPPPISTARLGGVEGEPAEHDADRSPQEGACRPGSPAGTSTAAEWACRCCRGWPAARHSPSRQGQPHGTAAGPARAS